MMRAVATLGLACTLVACGGGPPPPSAPSKLLGKKLPKIKRRTMGGEKVNTRDAEGRVVVVKFFAKYCKPCVKTLPVAEKLHRDNPDVLFVGVAEDEYQADVAEMIKRYNLTFPVVHDRGQILAGKFRVTQLPASIVAGKQGQVRWIAGPKHPHDALSKAVDWAKGGKK